MKLHQISKKGEKAKISFDVCKNLRFDWHKSMNRIWFLYKISHHCAKNFWLITSDWQPILICSIFAYYVYCDGAWQMLLALKSCSGWHRSERQVNWITIEMMEPCVTECKPAGTGWLRMDFTNWCYLQIYFSRWRFSTVLEVNGSKSSLFQLWIRSNHRHPVFTIERISCSDCGDCDDD